MKKMTFNKGLMFTFVASLFATICFSVLSGVLDSDLLIKSISSVVIFFYLVCLMQYSNIRTGRLTVILIWSIISIVLAYLTDSFILFLMLQILFIWLIRSLFYYSGVIAPLIDLCLTIFSLFIAIWAVAQTNSLFASVWCFFLFQATFVYIPENLRTDKKSPSTSENTFEQSFYRAKIAVRQLSMK
ncbi:MAG TPA: hypothetical protein ENJ08_19695 [Gammaproteobacteria bacterium]|nr:hypothetical protein [Gammaproteobacteria bacterium]